MLVRSSPQARYGADNGRLEELIGRCADGDREGMAALYESTRAAVYGFALSILKNVDDAQEVSQEVYVRVFRSAGEYRPRGKPMAWLLTVTKNLAKDRLRERSRSASLEDEALEKLSEDPRLTAEDRLALSSLLTRLSDDERQIVTMHALTGLRHREIAALLDLALPTVLSKYNRALKKLNRAWEEAQP